MDNLDKQIRDWGKRTTPPTDDRDTLKKNIMDAIETAPMEMPGKSPIPFGKIVVRLAAAGAILVAGITIGKLMNQSAPALTEETAITEGLSPEDLQEMKVVADEIDRLFPEGLRWISKINGQVSFKPEEKLRISSDDGDARLVVTYRVMRQTKSNSWEKIARHDIITWSGEPVDMQEQNSRLWCFLTDDQFATVDLDLVIQAAGRDLRVATNTIQELEKPSTVLETKQGDTTLRVIQTVYKI